MTYQYQPIYLNPTPIRIETNPYESYKAIEVHTYPTDCTLHSTIITYPLPCHGGWIALSCASIRWLHFRNSKSMKTYNVMIVDVWKCLNICWTYFVMKTNLVISQLIPKHLHTFSRQIQQKISLDLIRGIPGGGFVVTRIFLRWVIIMDCRNLHPLFSIAQYWRLTTGY